MIAIFGSDNLNYQNLVKVMVIMSNYELFTHQFRFGHVSSVSVHNYCFATRFIAINCLIISVPPSELATSCGLTFWWGIKGWLSTTWRSAAIIVTN